MLLPYFGVGKQIRRMLPTEQVRLEAVRATEDMLFEMEDDTLAHFEFESVEVTEDDLRRYRSYDAYTGMVLTGLFKLKGWLALRAHRLRRKKSGKWRRCFMRLPVNF